MKHPGVAGLLTERKGPKRKSKLTPKSSPAVPAKRLPTRRALTIGASAIGLTMFDPHTFIDLFSSAGLVSVEQQAQLALQFVAAEKPG